MARKYFDHMDSPYIRDDRTSKEFSIIREREILGVYSPSDPQRGRISEKWHDLYGSAINGYRSAIGTDMDFNGGTDAMFNVVEDSYISKGKKKNLFATVRLDWTNVITPDASEKFKISGGAKRGSYLRIGCQHLISSFGEKIVFLAIRLDNGVVQFKKAPVVVFQTNTVYDNQLSSAIEIDNLGQIAEAIVDSPYKHFCFNNAEMALL